MKHTLKERNDVQASLHTFIDDFFSSQENLHDQPITSVASEDHVEALLHQDIPSVGRDLETVMEEMMTSVYPYRLKNNHPRAFGFIPGPATPVSFLSDVMTSAYNVHASNWVNSSAAATIETNVIRWLTQQIGYDNHASGLFVSGGSMANLTAIIAARDTILNENRHLGCVYLSDQTHHSVEKALYIVGFLKEQIRFVPTTDQFKMNPGLLENMIKEDRKQGLIPALIIATAGTTNTGAVDPLVELADLRDHYNMWLHVDGAYGASFLLSPTHKCQLNGISRADSVSWDAHKLLYQNYACAMILVKEKKTLTNSFDADPEYLKDIDGGVTNFGSLGIELTRPARALKLWMSLQVIGTEAYGERIDFGHELAEYTKEVLMRYSHWEIISEPQFSIINFRYNDQNKSETKLNEINTYLAHTIVSEGFAGVYTTELFQKTVLRMCTINPETTHEDIVETIERLEHHLLSR